MFLNQLSESMNTILFDYGNVLCLPQSERDRVRLRNLCELDRSLFEELYWEERDAYDKGELSGFLYWKNILTKAKTAHSIELLQRLIDLDHHSWAAPNEVVWQWVSSFHKKGWRTGLLSNMGEDLAEFLQNRDPRFSAFDHRFFSYDIGLIKPDPLIYHHCIQTLGVPAQDIIFIDDRAINVEAACALGMKGIVFDDEDHCLKTLRAYAGITLEGA